MPRLILAPALGCGLLLPLGLSPARADDRCMVADPTGTPLNVDSSERPDCRHLA